MCQENYNTERKKNKHLTYGERIKIEVLSKERKENGDLKYTITDIANIIGVHKSTISREIKRGQIIKNTHNDRSYKIVYSAMKADSDYKYNRSKSHNIPLIYKDGNLKKFIEDKIKNEHWSPDVVSGYLKANSNKFNFNTNISTKTIYNNIHNKRLNITVMDTRRMMKVASKKEHHNHEQKESKKGKSIHLRDESINNRSVFGHWEMDCVIGTKTKGEVLLTLTERYTRFELIFKISDKTSISVVEAINIIKEKFGNYFSIIFKTITVDNGSEFSDWEGLEKNSNTFIYYADPYSSYQRGTNENHNGMIRWFIPKGTPMEKYSINKIKEIQNWMNDYPRKIFNYKTPKQMISEQLLNIEDSALIDLFFAL